VLWGISITVGFFWASIALLNKKHESFPSSDTKNSQSCQFAVPESIDHTVPEIKKIVVSFNREKEAVKKIITRQSGTSPRAESRTWMWTRIASLKQYIRLLDRFLAVCRFGSD
jgi:hypothetical protein